MIDLLSWRSLDLTQHKLFFDGLLTLNLAGENKRTKQIVLHVLLLEDCIMFLQKQVRPLSNLSYVYFNYIAKLGLLSNQDRHYCLLGSFNIILLCCKIVLINLVNDYSILCFISLIKLDKCISKYLLFSVFWSIW